MTVDEAITELLAMPPNAKICLLSGSEYFEIEGFEVKQAFQGSQINWIYSAVEWPSDWGRSDVVKIIRKKRP